MATFAVLQQRFDAMQARERTLLSVTIGVVLVLFLYVVLVEPAAKDAKAKAEQVASLEPQVESGRETLTRLQAELARDPEAERRVALDRLRQESGELDGRLVDDRSALIAPSRMPGILRDLLDKDGRLTVQGVRALPPEVVRWSPSAPAVGSATTTDTPTAVAPPAANAVPALYRHRVEVRLEGDFAAALDYVRAVDALPVRVRMDDLQIDARHWPRLGITMTVETLGLEEGWIGV